MRWWMRDPFGREIEFNGDVKIILGKILLRLLQVTKLL